MDGFEVFNNVSRDDLSGFVERKLKEHKEREEQERPLLGTEEHYEEMLLEQEQERFERGDNGSK